MPALNKDNPGDAFLRVLSNSMIPKVMFDTIWQNVSEAGIDVVWRDDIDAALQTLIRYCEGGYADAVAEAMDMEAARKGLERVSRGYSGGRAVQDHSRTTLSNLHGI